MDVTSFSKPQVTLGAFFISRYDLKATVFLLLFISLGLSAQDDKLKFGADAGAHMSLWGGDIDEYLPVAAGLDINFSLHYSSFYASVLVTPRYTHFTDSITLSEQWTKDMPVNVSSIGLLLGWHIEDDESPWILTPFAGYMIHIFHENEPDKDLDERLEDEGYGWCAGFNLRYMNPFYENHFLIEDDYIGFRFIWSNYEVDSGKGLRGQSMGFSLFYGFEL